MVGTRWVEVGYRWARGGHVVGRGWARGEHLVRAAVEASTSIPGFRYGAAHKWVWKLHERLIVTLAVTLAVTGVGVEAAAHERRGGEE